VADVRPTAVILTALSLEYDAVRAHLTGIEEQAHPTGTLAEVGQLPQSSWRVALVEIGEGVRNAAALTKHVIDWLEPAAVLFVGVAGSLRPEITIGDVVVATKAYAIHGGKETEDGSHVRPEAWQPSHRLIQAARSALRGKPGVHFKPIAVGDVVIAHSGSPTTERITHHFNDAVAIEMEGSGVLHAAHLSNLDALVVRGISDNANSRKGEADASGSQPNAARNAAEAAVAILRKATPAPGTGGTGATGDNSLLEPIEIGKGATFKGQVIGKDVQGEEPSGSKPTHLKIGEGAVFEGPVTGKRVGGR
jgi:nucleoside phosphorylase